jgi:hypothetical protein
VGYYYDCHGNIVYIYRRYQYIKFLGLWDLDIRFCVEGELLYLEGLSICVEIINVFLEDLYYRDPELLCAIQEEVKEEGNTFWSIIILIYYLIDEETHFMVPCLVSITVPCLERGILKIFSFGMSERVPRIYNS